MAYQTNYSARNFADIRLELLNYVKQYYPDIFSDFNDASVGTMLLELNAATADILSYHTDRMFQETQIDYACIVSWRSLDVNPLFVQAQ